jgi:predicted DNA-binding transcriptional regulator AlpA
MLLNSLGRSDSIAHTSASPPDSRPTPSASATSGPHVVRLAYRLDEVAAALGVSRRLIERERCAGRFPPPDLTIGRVVLWRPSSLERWMAAGGAGR